MMKSYEIGIEDPERDDRTSEERMTTLRHLYPELARLDDQDDDIG